MLQQLLSKFIIYMHQKYFRQIFEKAYFNALCIQHPYPRARITYKNKP